MCFAQSNTPFENYKYYEYVCYNNFKFVNVHV